MTQMVLLGCLSKKKKMQSREVTPEVVPRDQATKISSCHWQHEQVVLFEASSLLAVFERLPLLSCLLSLQVLHFLAS